MKKKKKSYNLLLAIGGLILLLAGLTAIKTRPDLTGNLQILFYVAIGAGCGIFGHGTANLISEAALAKDPEAARRLRIESNDERNLAITNWAKAKAYDRMIPIFGALLLVFAFMGVKIAAVLLLAAAYLFLCFTGVYYRRRFEKKM